MIRQWMHRHYKHFNAKSALDAAVAYDELITSGGKMLVSLAGAMSTGELGITLAEMIRQDKVHFISCTGANLEEDVMNLVGHDDYLPLPDYRTLSPQDEEDILNEGSNRVTDTAIPEEEVFGPIHDELKKLWKTAKEKNYSYFPHEYLYKILRSGVLEKHYQIDPNDSWMLAAAKKNLPIVCPGWEDSSMGNAFEADCMNGLYPYSIMKMGAQAMGELLAPWYLKNGGGKGVGFFQVGGGIAGDFPICAVPLIIFDAKKRMLGSDTKEREIAGIKTNVPAWSYFAQISDSTTSYGSYSGAVPNEKITWGKLEKDTPKFIIESDASLVAPLIFSYVLDL